MLAGPPYHMPNLGARSRTERICRCERQQPVPAEPDCVGLALVYHENAEAVEALVCRTFGIIVRARESASPGTFVESQPLNERLVMLIMMMQVGAKKHA